MVRSVCRARRLTTAAVMLPAALVGCGSDDASGYFTRDSDRSPGHPVEVARTGACQPGAATPLDVRTPGGCTYLDLEDIGPRYDAMMYDMFPGGWVTYRFDFPRGAHTALMAQPQSAVHFILRRQLQLEVERRLGAGLDS